MSSSSLRKKIFTIPNCITMFRFGIIFLLFWLWFSPALFTNEVIRIIIVIVVYALGALSDYFDGYWARHYKEKSKLGAFLDSLVDKFFTLSLFIAYLYIGLLEIWWGWVAAIIVRELYITGMRVRATLKKLVMVTEKHGKTKTAIQITFQSLMFAYFLTYAITYESTLFQRYLFDQGYSGVELLRIPFIIYRGFYQEIIGVSPLLIDIVWYLPNVLLSGVTVFTVYSGVSYILKARHRHS